MKKKVKSWISTAAMFLLMLAGAGIMAYPSVSSWWNSFHQTQALSDYDSIVQKIEDYDKYFDEADAYNEKLRQLGSQFTEYDKIHDDYQSALNVAGTGMIGYISIEKLDISLPIYHGTSEDVLNAAAGHLEGTSLPVGGKGTHAVISSHRGLPTAKLFTNLDEMEKGDTFTLTVLNRTLTYEVDQIVVVLPTQTDDLRIEEGKDYCTLVTCTPYGVNSHRMLVRGHRIKNKDAAVKAGSEAELVSFKKCSILTLAAVLAVMFVSVMLKKNKKKKKITLDDVLDIAKAE